MADLSKYCDITVQEESMQVGNTSIDNTKSNIEKAYLELKKANEVFLENTSGNFKTAFESAMKATEAKLRLAYGILDNLSLSIKDFTTVNMNIDEEAGLLAGGEKNE